KIELWQAGNPVVIAGEVAVEDGAIAPRRPALTVLAQGYVLFADEKRIARPIEDVTQTSPRLRLDHLVGVNLPRIGLAKDTVAEGIIHDGACELPSVGGVVSQASRILIRVGESGAGDLILSAQHRGTPRWAVERSDLGGLDRGLLHIIRGGEVPRVVQI